MPILHHHLEEVYCTRCGNPAGRHFPNHPDWQNDPEGRLRCTQYPHNREAERGLFVMDDETRAYWTELCTCGKERREHFSGGQKCEPGGSVAFTRQPLYLTCATPNCGHHWEAHYSRCLAPKCPCTQYTATLS